ncbi:DUF389 domain-containing protein [Synechococcus sp. H55.10]|uniref:DUF389 domain-containing protein n=1 Tax=Synechococcus sp. H55.10 TaxID=2964503 RepID=UPI0039C5AD04
MDMNRIRRFTGSSSENGLVPLPQGWLQPFRWRLPLVSAEEYAELVLELMRESRLSLNYLMLVLGSCVIATLGLLANSPAVIIGAMIVAPLMLPIRGMAMGALDGNVVLFRTGILSLTVGTGIGLGVSFLLGRWVGLPNWGSEILARTQPNLLDLGVALAAGGIGAFARVRKEIADSLAGVAIAVALMPPVCVIGLGLARGDWEISLGAALLYSTNLLGIALACMLTFLVMGYAPFAQGPFWIGLGVWPGDAVASAAGSQYDPTAVSISAGIGATNRSAQQNHYIPTGNPLAQRV